jgi:hypothetical protein
MTRIITIYTRKKSVIEYANQAFLDTDVVVNIDDTFRGRFLDPSFVDHHGALLVGYTPLFEYASRIRQGEQDPVVENPVGEAIAALWKRPMRGKIFDNYDLFGNTFSKPKTVS